MLDMELALVLPTILALLVAILWQLGRLARGVEELLDVDERGDPDASHY